LSRYALAASAALGEQVAALLDLDTPVEGVTTGKLRAELATVAVPATKKGAARDWTLRGWGNRTAAGITMPGRGRTDEREWSPREVACEERAALLGKRTRDVWMNNASFWQNVPNVVWEAHIGGYQVLKKWLSYRDGSIVGRPLSEGEITKVQEIVRRLTALKLFGADLDQNFEACADGYIPLVQPEPGQGI
jgi:Type ISP C-terminal specificity domain